MTDLNLLKQTFVSSVLVALTGIILPIALSFLLIPLVTPTTITALTAFGSGAALSSTSLGTTYAILSAAKLKTVSGGLITTKVGTIILTAAMVDDVVGLVMFKVITSLGNGFSAKSVLQPIGVSVAFLVGALVLMPILRKINVAKIRLPPKSVAFGFLITCLAIIGTVAASGYAGTSLLFVAYLTGLSASYLFKEGDKDIAIECYNSYLAPVSNGLLVPFFFVTHFYNRLTSVGLDRICYPDQRNV
jgi:Kef-type K+ transport system membrane component KefB